MKKFTIIVLMGLCLLFLQSSSWATIPNHTMLNYISDAFPIADGPLIGFAYKYITASTADTGSDAFYIEEWDRSSGIRIIWNDELPPAVRNHCVVVGGVLATIDGERVVIADYLLDLGNTTPVSPLAMDNPALGGRDFNVHTPGITDALGPYNKGLLARAWGYVTVVDEDERFFYIDDGTGIYDAYSNQYGVRVTARPGITMPIAGDYVVVTGISSSFQPDPINYPEVNARKFIVRDPSDIVYPTPTTLESKDALAPGTNIISVPGVPHNDGAGSAAPGTVFSTTNQWAWSKNKWNPTDQYWWDCSAGANVVYSDEGYQFLNAASSVLDPANGATVSYQAVLAIIEQTDRYIPLYAGANGINWIGVPFRTGIDTNRATVTDGARTYAPYYAAQLNWMERFGVRYDNMSQTSVTFDTAATDVYRPWEAYRITSKKPIALIVPAPGVSVQMLDRPDHVLAACEQSAIQARVTNAAGTPLAGIPVVFTTTSGGFLPNNAQTAVAATNASGIATVTFRAAHCGIAAISCYATVSGRKYAPPVIHATIDGLTLQLELGRFAARVNEWTDVVAKLRGCDMATPVEDYTVTLTTDQGVFTNLQSTFVGTTDANGEVRTMLKVTTCPVTATVTATLTACISGIKDTKQLGIDCDENSYDDWPMFMHDAQHTGLSKTWDIGYPDMVEAWSVDLPTFGGGRYDGVPTGHQNIAGGYTYIFTHPYLDSSPVVKGDKLVVGVWDRGTAYENSTGSVRAYDAETGGNPLWTSAAMGGVASTPCISGDYVYVGSADGRLYCLRLSDGGTVWWRQTTDRSPTPGNSKILSSPVIYGGVIYITNEASKIYAYNTSGTLLTGYPVSLPIAEHGVTGAEAQNVCGASSPAIANVGSYAYLLVGSDDGYVYRLRLVDRQLQAIFTGGCVESSPSVNGNSGVVGITWFGGISTIRFSVDPFKTLAYWNLEEESRATVSIAPNGHLYNGVDTGRTLFKLDKDAVGMGIPMERFDIMWRAQDYFVGSAAHVKSPEDNEGFLYSGNDNGRLYCLKESDLNLEWVYQLNPNLDPDGPSVDQISSSPAIAYNVEPGHYRWMYVTSRTSPGKLYAFRNPSQCSLELSYPGDVGPCEDEVVITAEYMIDDVPAVNMPVDFMTNYGAWAESGTEIVRVYTDGNGIAHATLQRPAGTNRCIVSATAGCMADPLDVTFLSYYIDLVANPTTVEPGQRCDLTVTLTDMDGNPAPNKIINVQTTNGRFDDATMNVDIYSDENGQINLGLYLDDCNTSTTVTARYVPSCVACSDAEIVTCLCDSWTSFQGDIENTGVTTSDLGANMVKKWRVQIAGNYDTELWSSPITDGASVWVATNSAQGTVYRFLTDGTFVDSEDLGSPVIGTPCLELTTGTLYVGTQAGELYSLNAATLETNWTFDCETVTEQIWSSPKYYGGAVYFSSTDPTINRSYLYVIDASGGYEWNTPTQMGSQNIYSSPAIDIDHPWGARVYLAGMYHISAMNLWGSTIWYYYTESYYYSSPSLAGGQILIGNSHKEMGVEGITDYGDHADWGKDPLPTADPVLTTVAAYNGKLYFGTNITISGFYAIADQALWQFDVMWPIGPINTSTLISPSTGLAFMATVAGTLYGLDLTDGSSEWSFDVRNDLGNPNATVKASYAASNDRMYIVAGTADARYLYCFGAP